ncbi:hypothetical protein [Kitasatospora cathayae]|uniref:Uncharacterized protein n=1 Tax=Kitasatospora cathayae TaxID=3004092 RepID=A0ABY7Q7V9_9ACTN|nr:hypothetical protein [Kitasatospora sp. HUAS 3-15]WBP88760.1 hypothetical protein O1G21_24940 [Kitasatospora sp. HUAS 3-15]
MRANHATEPQEPAPRGVAGARRAVARWLPRPRTLAAGGALLLAQLWGVGVPGAYAATAEPSSAQHGPVVHRALHGGPVLDGPSAVRPVGPAHPGTAGPGRSPGPVGGLTDGGPVDGAAGAVGDVLQERIRAGGLPLPGQGSAVPDAFALASGLLGTVPAQGRPAEARASHEGESATLPAVPRPRSGPADPGRPTRPEAAGTPPVRDATAHEEPGPAEPAGTSGAGEGVAARAVPAGDGTPAELALADTATATAEEDASATAAAVLAPIAAGLLLTGAAMCKHRGLPRGH